MTSPDFNMDHPTPDADYQLSDNPRHVKLDSSEVMIRDKETFRLVPHDLGAMTVVAAAWTHHEGGAIRLLDNYRPGAEPAVAAGIANQSGTVRKIRAFTEIVAQIDGRSVRITGAFGVLNLQPLEDHEQ